MEIIVLIDRLLACLIHLFLLWSCIFVRLLNRFIGLLDLHYIDKIDSSFKLTKPELAIKFTGGSGEVSALRAAVLTCCLPLPFLSPDLANISASICHSSPSAVPSAYCFSSVSSASAPSFSFSSSIASSASSFSSVLLLLLLSLSPSRRAQNGDVLSGPAHMQWTLVPASCRLLCPGQLGQHDCGIWWLLRRFPRYFCFSVGGLGRKAARQGSGKLLAFCLTFEALQCSISQTGFTCVGSWAFWQRVTCLACAVGMGTLGCRISALFSARRS